MGWFSNISANRKIIRKIMDMEAELESLPKLKRDLQSLDLEFTALFSKVKQALGRIEKRAAIIENSTGPEEEVAEPSLGTSSEGSLTPKQQEWQERIKRERRRTG